MPTRSSLAVPGHVLRELTLRRSLKSPPMAPRATSESCRARPECLQLRRDDRVSPEATCPPALLHVRGARLAPRVGPSPPAAQLYAAAGNVLGFVGLKELAWRYARLSHRIAATPPDNRCRWASCASPPATSPRCLAKWIPSTPTFTPPSTSTPVSATHRFREEALDQLRPSHGLRGELAQEPRGLARDRAIGPARDDCRRWDGECSARPGSADSWA